MSATSPAAAPPARMAETLRPARIGGARLLASRLFGTPFNAVLTLVCAALFVAVAWPMLRFLVIDAVWSGTDRNACLAEQVGRPVGACWPFVQAKFRQFIYGFYPGDQLWRVNLVFALGAVLLAPLLVPRVGMKRLNAIAFFGFYPVVAWFLLVGGGLDGFLFRLMLDLVATITGPWQIQAAWDGLRAQGAVWPFWLDYTASALVLAALLAWLFRARRGALMLLAGFALGAVLVLVMRLDRGGLPVVETRVWGGLLVTLVLSITGIVVSLPLGILLALGRRSPLPLIRWLSIIFIEFWRGVPLITVLFFATYMLPLFLPGGVNFDALLRVVVGVCLFAGAYMAEVIRGGLQAVPRGQYDAAAALGLGYWKTTGLIVMPQALRHVIPGIVNNFIGLFKDTTLVLIVAIFDFLGQLRAAFSDPNWSTPTTVMTGFAFAGFVYFVFCFAMSRYSQFVERRLAYDRRG